MNQQKKGISGGPTPSIHSPRAPGPCFAGPPNPPTGFSYGESCPGDRSIRFARIRPPTRYLSLLRVQQHLEESAPLGDPLFYNASLRWGFSTDDRTLLVPISQQYPYIYSVFRVPFPRSRKCQNLPGLRVYPKGDPPPSGLAARPSLQDPVHHRFRPIRLLSK